MRNHTASVSPSTEQDDPSYVIGVDAGGSSSHAVSVSRAGKLLRQRRGQAGNPHVYGVDASIDTLSSLIQFVTVDDNGPPTAIMVALSGADTLSFCVEYTARLRKALCFPLSTHISVAHDLIGPIGLLLPDAGVEGEDSKAQRNSEECMHTHLAVLIAGTGSVAGSFRVADSEFSFLSTEEVWYSGPKFAVALEKRCGGRGPLLGDMGSAYDISISALKLAFRVVDDLQIPPMNFPDFAEESDVPTLKRSAHEVLRTAFHDFDLESGSFENSLDQLVTFVHSNTQTRARIATLSSSFSHLAASGNIICRYSFYKAGHVLGQHLGSVLSDFSEENRHAPPRMIATGGVFMAWNLVPDFQNAFKGAVSPITKCGGRIMVRTASSSPVRGHDGQSHALACACLLARAYGWSSCSSTGESDVACSCDGYEWIP